MSRADFSTLRADLVRWAAAHGEGAYRALSTRMGGTPSDEALRLFAEGTTKAPRFAEKLAAALGGGVSEPDLAEEAEQALRLIRQGQERLARVVLRLREADHASDEAAALAARVQATMHAHAAQVAAAAPAGAPTAGRRRRKAP